MNDYLTKAEFQAYKKSIDDKLALILERLYGRDPAELIKLADLDDEVLAELDTTKFYKIGTQIRERDLPTNVATKTYVDGKTRGIVSPVTAPSAIDELVAAREGEVALVTNLNDNYCAIEDIVTNINADTDVIDKERCEPHDHNTTTNRDASDAHPISSVTNLQDELDDKSYIVDMIGNINTNTAQIVGSIAITNGGTGYTAGALIVDNTGTGGSGLAGTYTVSGGVIDGITITNNGSGYITAPTVTGDPGGSNAILDPSLTDELIDLDKIEVLDHNDSTHLTGTGDADCHPTSAITGLDTILNNVSGAVDEINETMVGGTGYASITTWLQCWNDVIVQLMAATGVTNQCFKDITP